MVDGRARASWLRFTLGLVCVASAGCAGAAPEDPTIAASELVDDADSALVTSRRPVVASLARIDGSPQIGFQGTLTAVGANIANIQWDFGDAAVPSVVSGLAPAVTFRRAGVVPVRIAMTSTDGIPTTTRRAVTVQDIAVTARAVSPEPPFHNGTGMEILTVPGSTLRAYAMVIRRRVTLERAVEVGFETPAGDFTRVSFLPAGMTDPTDVRMVIGTDRRTQLLVKGAAAAGGGTRAEHVAHCTFVASAPVCNVLDKVEGAADIALRSDNKAVISYAQARGASLAEGGLRLVTANATAPRSLADYSAPTVVDGRTYRLYVHKGGTHALALLDDRPVLVAHNGLPTGTYPGGARIFPVQLFEAVGSAPTGPADFRVRDVHAGIAEVAGARLRAVGGRLVAAYTSGGVTRVSHAALSDLTRWTHVELGTDTLRSAYTAPRVGLSVVADRWLVSAVERDRTWVRIGLVEAPSSVDEFLKLDAFSLPSNYYQSVLGGFGRTASSLSLFALAADGSATLATGR